MKSIPVIYIILSAATLLFAQKQNPTTFPYGGRPDSSRVEDWVKKVPITFDSTANFQDALFENRVYLAGSLFNCAADFQGTRFFWPVSFVSARFYYPVDFSNSRFHSRLYLGRARVYSAANFSGARFNGETYFGNTHFRNGANFRDARFFDITFFRNTDFSVGSDFTGAHFYSLADFRGALFDSLLFNEVIISGELILNPDSAQKIDLTSTTFTGNALLRLSAPAILSIQPEKIKYIALGEISWSKKRSIIDTLKNRSFKNNRDAQRELDYLFARSTMFQDASGESYWYQVWKWPGWIANCIYYLTMGLGYRPFRIVYWALFLIIGYSVVNLIKKRNQN